MRLFPLGLLLISVCAPIAQADPLVVGQLNGPGLQVFQSSAKAQLSFQCPHMAVYWRPAGCSGCVVDAGAAVDGGVGDFIADFNANPDPVPVSLAAGDTSLVFANVDGGLVGCSIAREAQP